MEDKTYKVINKDSKHPIILTCEHASNKIPKGYENLGLEGEICNYNCRLCFKNITTWINQTRY